MRTFRAQENVTNASLVGSMRPQPPLPDEQPATHSTTSLHVLPQSARMCLVEAIKGPTRSFALKSLLSIELEHSPDGVIARNRRLHVSGYGETASAALSDFGEMFEVQWDGLVDAAETELAADAKLVRRDLLSLAEPLEPRNG